MQIRHVKHPFPPVIDGNCKVLVLGSVPSVKSCENGFYYMHPQNRFWRVLSVLLDAPLCQMTVEQRAQALLKRGVALYDSVEECDIEGSSDNKIFNVVPADIPALLDCAPIRHIFANGKASFAYLTSFYPQLADISSPLPSTSPANAAFSLNKLIACWSVLSDFLLPL